MTEFNPFEAIEAITASHHDRTLMMIQAKQNAIHELLDRMSDEDLALIGSYTTDLALGAAHEGTYWQGIIEQKLRARGVCQHCGRDHTAELLGDDHTPVEKVDAAPTADLGWEQPTFDDVQADATANILANATTWGVFFKDPQNLQGPVICGDCGAESVSLEDRMLRQPGVKGCLTCQQKVKWG